MQFSMVTSDTTIISRLQQCGSAHNQRRKLAEAANDTSPRLNPEAIGSLRFNIPKGTLEIPISTTLSVTSEHVEKLTQDFYAKLGQHLEPQRIKSRYLG